MSVHYNELENIYVHFTEAMDKEEWNTARTLIGYANQYSPDEAYSMKKEMEYRLKPLLIKTELV